MDYEARRKEGKYISRVEARAYVKLEAKARSGHDLEGRRLRWKVAERYGGHEREETHQARCPNNGRGWLDALNKDGRRLRGRRRRRRLGHPTVQGRGKACGVQPVTLSHQLSFLCCSSASISNIYFIFACGGPTDNSAAGSETCGRVQTKRSARRAVDCQHQTSYGVRHSGIRNAAPSLPQSPFSSLDMTDVRSRLADTHQLRCTPTLIPPEKEGVPIVRISV